MKVRNSLCRSRPVVGQMFGALLDSCAQISQEQNFVKDQSIKFPSGSPQSVYLNIKAHDCENTVCKYQTQSFTICYTATQLCSASHYFRERFKISIPKDCTNCFLFVLHQGVYDGASIWCMCLRCSHCF